MKTSGIIYYYPWDYRVSPPTPNHHSGQFVRILGIGLLALSLGGLVGPLSPIIRMEGGYRLMQAKTFVRTLLAVQGQALQRYIAVIPAHAGIQRIISWIPGQAGNDKKTASETTTKTVVFTPLTAPDGSEITPVDTNFSLVIPKIGLNAKVIPAVNPTNPEEYEKALTEGVAHASTSYFPNENGTVYLFSHSTSYDWFVKDLHAVFYLVKNLEVGDQAVIVYKGDQYTYKITDKKVVSPESVAYLVPHRGTKNLILQTCWPPGSVEERLLIFADLVEEHNQTI